MLAIDLRLRVAGVKLLLTAEMLLADLSTGPMRYLRQKKLNCEHVIQVLMECIALAEARDRHLEVPKQAALPPDHEKWASAFCNDGGWGVLESDTVVNIALERILLDVDTHWNLQRKKEREEGLESAPMWVHQTYRLGQWMLRNELEKLKEVWKVDIQGLQSASLCEVTKVKDFKGKEVKRRQDYAHFYLLYKLEQARQDGAGEYDTRQIGQNLVRDYSLEPPDIDVPLLKSILEKNAHLPLAEIPLHDALKAPEDPHPPLEKLTKSQQRQRRKKANREAKRKDRDHSNGKEEEARDCEESLGTGQGRIVSIEAALTSLRTGT